MSLILNPDIFKAYDVRGTYPDEINEDGARAIGAAFVAYLGAKRIAVGRDMRLSSPSLAAAFIDGATAQGADVVDYGMIPTDMLYFAVARDRHDGGVEVTASHNPKQYNGMKMVRQEAFPLSGDEGISDIRDMIAADRLPPPAARRGQVTTRDVLAAYVEHVMSFIDPAVIKPFNVVLDAGSGMGGLVAPQLFDRLPCRTTRLCFEIDGRFPEPRSQSAHRREPPRHRRAGDRREGRHRHRLGRRRRPLLLHRRRRRVRVGRLHHGAARRSVPAEASRRRRSSTICAPATPSETSSRTTAARR